MSARGLDTIECESGATDGMGGNNVALAWRSVRGCFVADSASFSNVGRILDLWVRA